MSILVASLGFVVVSLIIISIYLHIMLLRWKRLAYSAILTYNDTLVKFYQYKQEKLANSRMFTNHVDTADLRDAVNNIDIDGLEKLRDVIEDDRG